MDTVDRARTLQDEARARAAFFDFYRSFRYPSDADEDAFVARGSRVELSDHVPPLFACSFGPGEKGTVLCVHGAHGRCGQFRTLAGYLADRGYRVVVFDAPGHGRTAGESIHGSLCGSAMVEIQKTVGHYHAIVAHSMGTNWALCTLPLLSVSRLVLLSPPATNRIMIDKYLSMRGLRGHAAHFFEELLEAFEGKANLTTNQTSESIVSSLSLPGLVVHDDADPVVPVGEAKAVVRAWKSASLVTTSGLGHYGSLSDEMVCDEILSLLDSGESE